eukprot:14090687-Heterocapsa_arctica.AAC.1
MSLTQQARNERDQKAGRRERVPGEIGQHTVLRMLGHAAQADAVHCQPLTPAQKPARPDTPRDAALGEAMDARAVDIRVDVRPVDALAQVQHHLTALRGQFQRRVEGDLLQPQRLRRQPLLHDGRGLIGEGGERVCGGASQSEIAEGLRVKRNPLLVAGGLLARSGADELL